MRAKTWILAASATLGGVVVALIYSWSSQQYDPDRRRGSFPETKAAYAERTPLSAAAQRSALEAAAASMGLSVDQLRNKAAEGAKALLAQGLSQLATAKTPAEARAAFLDIRAAADAGNADASLQMAKMLENGIGTRRDLSAAFSAYLAAARAGNAEAQLKVASMFEEGRGTAVNYAAAAQWYEEAAKNGEAGGWLHLGYLHAEGRGVVQNHATALSYYQQAAAAGNIDALGAMGMAKFYGRGLPADPVAGLQELALAADQGSARAALGLSKIHADGAGGLSKNTAEALSWLKKAADLGDSQAQVILARQLATGAWGEQDIDRARTLFMEAAVNGSGQALTDLGRLTLKTNPTAEGFKQTLDYARDAYLAGNSEAAMLLAQLSLINPPPPEAEQRIRDSLEIAGDEGNWRARYATELLNQDVPYADAILQATNAEREDVANHTLASHPSAPRSTPAVAIRMPPPQLDANVLAQGLAGTINVSFTVTRTGSTRNIKLQSPASPAVEAAVRTAVASWQFQPAMEAGKPVLSRMTIPVSLGKSQ